MDEMVRCPHCGCDTIMFANRCINCGKHRYLVENIGIDMSNTADFTGVVTGSDRFVGYLGKTPDGKVELAKKEIIRGYSINKGRLK